MKNKYLISILIIIFAAGLLLYPRPAAISSPISLVFLGDIMLGRGVTAAHQAAGDWSSALAGLKSAFSNSDLIVANLESPITSKPLQKSTYDLRASRVALSALSSAGIGLVSLANNHSSDAGSAGLADTENALASAQIKWVGPNEKAAVFNIRGVKMVFIAAQAVDRPLDVDGLCRQSTQLAKTSDWVTVLLHWGSEYVPAPDSDQVADAQRLADCGVDIIIGSHPHVVQKSAWLNSSDGAHRTFVAYSLGNTLLDQPSPPDAHSGLLLKITLENQDSIRVQPVPLEIDWAAGRTRLAQGETVISVLERFNLPGNFQTPSPTQ